AKILELCLDHRAKVARGMVSKLDHATGLALEHDHHSATELGCRNSHWSLTFECKRKQPLNLDRANHRVKIGSVARHWSYLGPVPGRTLGVRRVYGRDVSRSCLSAVQMLSATMRSPTALGCTPSA